MAVPPVSLDADVRDFPYFPLFRRRLFASTFHLQANDSEWRAGVTLWLTSWDQVPAGSLPNDDRQLCRLAGLGRHFRAWSRVKKMALHGWRLCDDGRLYHDTVAEAVNKAFLGKKAARARTAAATEARRNVQRNDDRNDQRNVPPSKKVESGRTITNKGNRPSREPNGSLLPPFPPYGGETRAPAREGGGQARSVKKSPRTVQTEAFYHAALDSQRSHNC